ncbi:PAS domain S-box-containing protein [Desulfatibacillum alkenivorans DSM 16219]|jgi:PAS domain S-box-containing protein|uniref:PAS domain S-box-containing protein n=1 Tax=Desulfatibacillum alkenivorans DSM 16219 TaxID=1121393 RepID=A0A1M6CNS7_9BACT|nr:LuxR C-terminal-related transcriptional regulator [Desulfatibacillum alkenivorans]SHI62666.1 PAS domain S-box-containing protein [Desulfatibacillum alkenivorans DSM 16219]
MSDKPKYEELEQELNDLKARVAGDKFTMAFKVAPYSMAIVRLIDGLIIEANARFCQMTGLMREELLGRTTLELGMWDDPKEREVIRKIVERDGSIRNFEIKDRFGGKLKHGLYSAEKIIVNGESCMATTVVDVSELREAQEALAQSTPAGPAPMTNPELEVKTRELEEVNKALRTLLDQTKNDAKNFEQRILANVEDLILPYVSRLKNTPLDINQRVYLNVVETNLTDLISPFMRMIGEKHNELTPREIEVANLVRMGTTSKEIAKLLNISKRAVEFHRDSLRTKLGLKKSKKNLRAYLASLN